MSIDPHSAAAVSSIEPDPAQAYRAALVRYEPEALHIILRNLQLADQAGRASDLASDVIDRLDARRDVGSLVIGLPFPARVALGILSLITDHVWSVGGFTRALRLLGVVPGETLAALLSCGLVAVRIDSARPRSADLEAPPLSEWSQGRIHPLPAAIALARTMPPGFQGARLATRAAVRQVREADGLEPILRLAALWQRVAASPLRQTQQGTLYKRDRERLDADPALAGPIADMLEPLPDMLSLWLVLALELGLIRPEPGTDRVVAAPASYWVDNAVHLPQMVALRWLALRGWSEHPSSHSNPPEIEAPGPSIRVAILLRLADLDPDEWIAIDDLANDLTDRCPSWNTPIRTGIEAKQTVDGLIESETTAVNRSSGSKRHGCRRPRSGVSSETNEGLEWLRAMLLGSAYQFGLVRVAEEDPSGRRVVQLTDLGRYVLALGPPPVRPGFEHFLFVQPNFEIVAYRQGLNPSLIGQFSRFALWAQIGAALELVLTPEDLYRGLEGGLTLDAILGRLSRHSERALPAGVSETLRTWAARRERVVYHASATLLEFATKRDLEQALDLWPIEHRPTRVAERLLLTDGEQSIPFQGFRMLGARDYRRAPESCIQVESDGITLSLDPSRSDLLVDAELGRLADEVTLKEPEGGEGLPCRRFRLTPASLDRALAEGLTVTHLSRWFRKRTGEDIPPATRLLLHARGRPDQPVAAARKALVLMLDSAELLDGLVQHPATRTSILERLGPKAALLSESGFEEFCGVLAELGLSLDEDSTSI